jgi:hypothetical protein
MYSKSSRKGGHMSKLLKSAVMFGLAGLASGGIAQADVTIEQKVTLSGNGMMSMMSSDGTVITMISGDRSRSDNRIEPRSAMMKRLSPNMDTSSIVLLNEQKVLNLNPSDKTWSEVTFAQMREQMDEAMAQMKSMQGQGALPVAEDECTWSEPVIKSEKTGAKERFADIKADQHIITASQTCTVPDSGQQCEMSWQMEYWNASRMPGDDEALEFQQAMAEAMGGDELMALAKTHSAGMLAMFKQGWEGVLEEFEGLRGYPVKTVMSMSIGGENCTTASGEPIAMDDIWGDAAQAGMDAAGQRAAGEAGSIASREAAEAMGDSVGGRIAGSALGAAGRELASGMFKSFGRKNKDESSAVEAAPAAATTGGTVTLFTISTELTGVSEKPIDSSQFEVPAGWKKVAAPGT